MTTSERIKAISNKRTELNNAECAKKKAITKENEIAIAKIKGFANDFKELMEIADAMQKHGFTLGKITHMTSSPEFVTEWWSHCIGFYPDCNPSHHRFLNLKGFGRMNGGACGNVDLIIDLDGNILSYGEIFSDGRMVDVIGFAEHFNDFKSKFLSYVDTKF